MIGKVINERYTITDKLGGGGMSIVYLAEDSILNRKVAIKAISIPPSEKEETFKRFEREVHNSSQLSHENIVSMIDVDEEDEDDGDREIDLEEEEKRPSKKQRK